MRRSTLKPSRGTVWPPDVAKAIHDRDRRCVGPLVGMPGVCEGPSEKHHIRTGGMGMKSPSTLANGCLLCSNVHHPYATEHGREVRPVLLAYVEFMARRVA